MAELKWRVEMEDQAVSGQAEVSAGTLRICSAVPAGAIRKITAAS